MCVASLTLVLTLLRPGRLWRFFGLRAERGRRSAPQGGPAPRAQELQQTETTQPAQQPLQQVQNSRLTAAVACRRACEQFQPYLHAGRVAEKYNKSASLFRFYTFVYKHENVTKVGSKSEAPQ